MFFPIEVGSMSIWATVASGANSPMTEVLLSVKRVPRARMKSELWTIRLAISLPCVPMKPRLKPLGEATEPIPIIVVTKGTFAFCTKTLIWSQAFPSLTPPPMMMTGRSLRLRAWAIRSN